MFYTVHIFLYVTRRVAFEQLLYNFKSISVGLTVFVRFCLFLVCGAHPFVFRRGVTTKGSLCCKYCRTVLACKLWSLLKWDVGSSLQIALWDFDRIRGKGLHSSLIFAGLQACCVYFDFNKACVFWIFFFANRVMCLPRLYVWLHAFAQFKELFDWGLTGCLGRTAVDIVNLIFILRGGLIFRLTVMVFRGFFSVSKREHIFVFCQKGLPRAFMIEGICLLLIKAAFWILMRR